MKTFDEAYEVITSNGWLDREEAVKLWEWAKLTTGTIVEVGSFRGRSAMLLAQLGRPLLCVDPWDDYFHSELNGDQILEDFIANTARFNNVQRVRSRVEDLSSLPLAGFVYLDGDHTYQGTLAQIRAALLCKPQIIAIHDVNDSGGGIDVKRAALEILGSWDERVDRLAVWINP